MVREVMEKEEEGPNIDWPNEKTEKCTHNTESSNKRITGCRDENNLNAMLGTEAI